MKVQASYHRLHLRTKNNDAHVQQQLLKRRKRDQRLAKVLNQLKLFHQERARKKTILTK